LQDCQPSMGGWLKKKGISKADLADTLNDGWRVQAPKRLLKESEKS